MMMKAISVILFFVAFDLHAQVPGSSGSSFVVTTIEALDASSKLDISKVYWISDPGKEGSFVFDRQVRDQSTDNGGTIIVNTALQQFRRVYSGYIDARWFGVVADAIVPQRGNLVRGTDNTPALQRAINAAEDGEPVVVPAGKCLFATPLDSIKGPRRVNLLIFADTYHNGSDFIIITNPNGAYEQHTIRHEGTAFGSTNLPRHTKQTHDNGTGPKWNELKGTFVKIFNAYQQKIEVNKVEGFKAAVELIGGHGAGTQENTVVIRSAYKNANGIVLTSLDGASYIDKNEFRVSRLSGGLGIKIDGYAGKAKNGEVYNGAARSNRFHVMIEQVDSIAECHGDITETLFDVTVEGGDNTGVFGRTGFRMRSVAPNFVRSPRYTGQGIFEERMIQEGMGVGGTIFVPVWNSKKGIMYGNFALIDNEGNIVFQGPSTLPQAYRDGAPKNFRFVNFGESELEETVTSAEYTVAPHVRYVYYKHASGKLKLPPAHASVGRLITVFNEHDSGKLTVLNAPATNIISIRPGGVMTYRSNGKTWRSLYNP